MTLKKWGHYQNNGGHGPFFLDHGDSRNRKKGYPYSNLSTGGPRISVEHPTDHPSLPIRRRSLKACGSPGVTSAGNPFSFPEFAPFLCFAFLLFGVLCFSPTRQKRSLFLLGS